MAQEKPEIAYELDEALLSFSYEAKSGKVVSVYDGIPRELLPELVRHTNEDEVLRSTVPSDLSRRFGTEEMAAKYIASRDFYTLVVDEELAGVVWFGESQWHTDVSESPSHTFATRTYEPYRGQGYSGDLVRNVIKQWTFDHAHKITGAWLEVNLSNPDAQRLYDRTGWIPVDMYEKEDDNGVLQTRIIMQLDIKDSQYPAIHRLLTQPVEVYRKPDPAELTA